MINKSLELKGLMESRNTQNVSAFIIVNFLFHFILHCDDSQSPFDASSTNNRQQQILKKAAAKTPADVYANRMCLLATKDHLAKVFLSSLFFDGFLKSHAATKAMKGICFSSLVSRVD